MKPCLYIAQVELGQTTTHITCFGNCNSSLISSSSTTLSYSIFEKEEKQNSILSFLMFWHHSKHYPISCHSPKSQSIYIQIHFLHLALPNELLNHFCFAHYCYCYRHRSPPFLHSQPPPLAPKPQHASIPSTTATIPVPIYPPPTYASSSNLFVRIARGVWPPRKKSSGSWFSWTTASAPLVRRERGYRCCWRGSVRRGRFPLRKPWEAGQKRYGHVFKATS